MSIYLNMNFLFNGEVVDYDYYKSNNDGDLYIIDNFSTAKANHYYKSENTRQTILFLHGWGGNKHSFDFSINLLKSKFNIIAITMPTILETNMAWNNDLYCELVLSILKTYNINSAIVVCHSFGFRVAILLKEHFKIIKLVVTGGAGIKRTNIFKKIEQNNNKILLSKEKFKFLFSSLASTDYKTLPKINKQTFKNVVNTNYKNLIEFNCPILLFWGKRDGETKFWIAKKLKKKNSAKLIVTEGGHFAYLEQKALFNNALVSFLK